MHPRFFLLTFLFVSLIHTWPKSVIQGAPELELELADVFLGIKPRLKHNSLQQAFIEQLQRAEYLFKH